MSCEIMNKVFKEINDKSTRIEFLSQKLDLSTKSISQAVGNLIKHGYVTTSHYHPNNHRNQNIFKHKS